VSKHDDSALRLSRFGDWSSLRRLCVTAPSAAERPFYAGQDVDSRMALVRRAIEEIRVQWHRYPAYMADLKHAMQPSVTAGQDLDLRRRAEQLFVSRKEWVDESGANTTEEYSALRLYTSAAGYRQMFGTLNRAFRDDGLTAEASVLRAAVFMVELLSIDLFNYAAWHDRGRDYEGRIYRGMVVTPQELDQFSTVAARPVAERYVAIPLGMASATTDRATALVFVEEQARRSRDGQPLLWEIDVIGLPPERLDVYRTAFPASVVTTICAVPIKQLSDFPDEDEILLRGPFFQLLRLRRTDESIGGKPLQVIEALTITANRDHPSTMRLAGPEATAARDIFRTLVTAERCRRAADRAVADDARAFSRFASEQERELDDLLRSLPGHSAGTS
jgi:hypothetical protein